MFPKTHCVQLSSLISNALSAAVIDMFDFRTIDTAIDLITHTVSGYIPSVIEFINMDVCQPITLLVLPVHLHIPYPVFNDRV